MGWHTARSQLDPRIPASSPLKNARSGTRTHTETTSHRILSPARLPIPPSGLTLHRHRNVTHFLFHGLDRDASSISRASTPNCWRVLSSSTARCFSRFDNAGSIWISSPFLPTREGRVPVAGVVLLARRRAAPRSVFPIPEPSFLPNPLEQRRQFPGGFARSRELGCGESHS